MSTPSNPLDITKPLISAISKKMRLLLAILLIQTIFGAMLVPLLLALIYFSTAHTRKTPLLWITLLDVCLGLVIAIWEDYAIVCTTYHGVARRGEIDHYSAAQPIIQPAKWCFTRSIHYLPHRPIPLHMGRGSYPLHASHRRIPLLVHAHIQILRTPGISCDGQDHADCADRSERESVQNVCDERQQFRSAGKSQRRALQVSYDCGGVLL
jgi:hypothetical protein